MAQKDEVIETTVGKVAEAAAELARRGLDPDDRRPPFPMCRSYLAIIPSSYSRLSTYWAARQKLA